MNILFLNLYSGGVERGAESFTHELVSRLGDKHQVRLVMGGSDLQPQSQFSGNIFSKILKRLFLDKPGRQVLFFTLKYVPQILKSDFDVIFPLNGFWQLLIVKLLQPVKRYKIIVTGHSGPGWDERWNLYLKPDYFVATTGPTLDWARKTCPYTKSILIPYAVDVNQYNDLSGLFSSEAIESSFNKPQKPVILCPAALVPYKRIDLAIKAVAKLKKGSLLVLGKGELEPKLHSLGKKLLGKRFLLTSAPHQDIAHYYQASNIVTLPSKQQENSPMVFIEALAAGKMVVATDTPRNRWMLEDSGIYINPSNTKAYVEALSQALNTKPDTSKALQKFSWESVLNKYNQIIERN